MTEIESSHGSEKMRLTVVTELRRMFSNANCKMQSLSYFSTLREQREKRRFTEQQRGIHPKYLSSKIAKHQQPQFLGTQMINNILFLLETIVNICHQGIFYSVSEIRSLCFHFWFSTLHALSTPWNIIIVYPRLAIKYTRKSECPCFSGGLSDDVKATSLLENGSWQIYRESPNLIREFKLPVEPENKLSILGVKLMNWYLLFNGHSRTQLVSPFKQTQPAIYKKLIVLITQKTVNWFSKVQSSRHNTDGFSRIIK